jgi:nitrogen fixation/metabolism regulation signal transduction histidine kinase
MLVAVTIPLATSAVLLTMAVDSSFQVGVNRRVHQGLARGTEVYRTLFGALKEDFARSTDYLALVCRTQPWLAEGDWEAGRQQLQPLVEGRTDLAELTLAVVGVGPVVSLTSSTMPPVADSREWHEERRIQWEGGEAVLTARWLAPRAHFQAFHEAGDTLASYETLQGGRLHVRNRYLAVYAGLIGLVMVLALILGVTLSRRVTRRVSRLWAATQQVAGGDLTTRVPVGPGDEVGELAAAFNVMVARLHESRDRIEYLQRVAAWQQLARRLAHEIKNPLTPIQLAVEELAGRYQGEDRQFGHVLQQATEIVREEVEALRRLTTEFSAFAKLPQVDAVSVDLREFLLESKQALQLLATDGRQLLFDLPPPGIEVRLDKMLMKRVLDNMVRNALEAFDEDRQDGQVVVGGGRGSTGEPCITVSDNGPGITEDERSRIFEPYHTTKNEGTGLGLAIVKKIVLEHGGYVAVRSQPGEGTTFTIWFST